MQCLQTYSKYEVRETDMNQPREVSDGILAVVAGSLAMVLVGWQNHDSPKHKNFDTAVSLF